MDGLRVTFSFVGIMYHMAWWYLQFPEKSIEVKYFDYPKVFYFISEIIPLFRMDTFFLIAGFFTAISFSKLNFRDFLKNRVKNLHILGIVPVVFILTTFTSYYQAINSGNLHPFSGGYWQSLVFLHHLWFLVILFMLYGIYAFLSNKTNTIDFLQNKLKPVHLLFLSLIYLCWAILAKLFPVLWSHNSFIDILYRLFIYLPYFMLGAAIFLNKKIYESFMKFSYIKLLACIIFVSIYLYFLSKQYGLTVEYKSHDIVYKLVKYFSKGIASLSAIHLVFIISSNIFKRDSKLLAYLTKRSYTVYLLHLPLCWIFGYYLTTINISVGFKFIISVICVYVITLLMHDFLMRLTNFKPVKLKVMEPI